MNALRRLSSLAATAWLLILAAACGADIDGRVPEPAEALALPPLAAFRREVLTDLGGAYSAKGSGYFLTLPHQAHSTVGQSSRFTPDSAAGPATLSQAAYCGFRFILTSTAGLEELQLDWSVPPGPGELWLALANWQAQRWDWYQPADPSSLTLQDFSSYFDAEGTAYVMVLVFGSDPCMLDELGFSGMQASSAPLARLQVSSLQDSAPCSIDYDCSASLDPDGGAIVLYELDSADDGSFEISQTEPPAGSLQYSQDGKYPLRLRVTDDEGSVGETRIVITVSGEAQWTDQPLALPSAGAALLWDPTGLPSLVVLNGEALEFHRALSPDLTSWSEAVLIDDTDSASAALPQMCMVNGCPAVAYVRDLGSQDELRYRRALDPAGSQWGPIEYLSMQTPAVRTDLHLDLLNGRPAVRYFSSGNKTVMMLQANDVLGESWPVDPRLTYQIQSASELMESMTRIVTARGLPYFAVSAVGTVRSIYLVAGTDPDLGMHKDQAALVETPEVGFDFQPVEAALIGDSLGLTYVDGNQVLYLSCPVSALNTGFGEPQPVGLTPYDQLSGIDLAELGGYPAITFATAENQPGFNAIYYRRAVVPDGSTWSDEALLPLISTNNGPPFGAPSLGLVAGQPAIYSAGSANHDTLLLQ